jgi:hypothetical protein
MGMTDERAKALECASRIYAAMAGREDMTVKTDLPLGVIKMAESFEKWLAEPAGS